MFTEAHSDGSWTPISSQDYIFGFTTQKFTCWSSGISSTNIPSLQVYENGQWIEVAKGIILQNVNDLSTPCSNSYPIAVGYQWTFMNPPPPSGLSTSTRYSVLYRHKFPDTVSKVSVQVTKLIPTEILKTRYVSKLIPENVSKTHYVKKIVKVPYIATIKKSGKNVKVIKYKNVTKFIREDYLETIMVERTVPESYSETILVEKLVTEIQDKITPGVTTSSGNISVYPSEFAATNEAIALAAKLRCALNPSTCIKP